MTDRFITSKELKHLLGDVSDMTLWRLQNDPDSGFPPPRYVGRRRFWREADVRQWFEGRPSRAPQAA